MDSQGQSLMVCCGSKLFLEMHRKSVTVLCSGHSVGHFV